MDHSQLLNYVPAEHSISERVVLIPPHRFPMLRGKEIGGCRIFVMVSRGRVILRKREVRIEIAESQFIDLLAWEPVRIEEIDMGTQAWCLVPNYQFTNESLNGMHPVDSEPFRDRFNIPLMTLTLHEKQCVMRQLELMDEALHAGGHFYRIELCRSYFRNFLMEVGNVVLHRRQNVEECMVVENRQDWIVRNFLKLVWRNYRSEHNMVFYAENIGISEKHLTRVVRDALGKTPYAVVRDELLQHAIYLLRSSKMAIQEIASELHFSETASFCKFFRKNVGVSPTSYRTQSNQNPTNPR